MSDQLHATIRHCVSVLGIVTIGSMALFAVLHRVAPPPAPIHGPVAVFTPSPLEHEVQALIDADQALAQKSAGVPVTLQPAIAVVKDSGVVKGLTDAQISQILSALKPKTVEAVAVHSVLSAPTPAPTPATGVYQQIYAADYAATTHALRDTKIKTDVNITRQEVAPSRIGSLIASSGSGISYAFLRRGQFEVDAGLVQPNTVPHLIGAGAIIYDIPHTSLGLGPEITYNRGIHYGIGAVVHF